MPTPTDRFHSPAHALTYDDVLLVPAYSEVLPRDVSLGTSLGPRLRLHIPVLASAMDTVSEAPVAIAMAREGAMAVIHKNLSPGEQSAHVVRVKASDAPLRRGGPTCGPGDLLGEAARRMREAQVPDLPVIDALGRVLGVLTRRGATVGDGGEAVRTQMGELVVALDEGFDMAQAIAVFEEHGFPRIYVVDGERHFLGTVTLADIELRTRHPRALRDGQGRLMTAAAVGPGEDCDDRVAMLVQAGVDAIVVDTAHGHSRNVLTSVGRIRARYPDLPLVAGNVATAEAVAALAEAGVDVVKVGIGPGSICTTRIVAGVGVPQITAIFACVAEARRRGVAVIADGGIKHSGDIVKALAAGADAVMIGSLLAGTDESPGDVVLRDGVRCKAYRGMGSIGAMAAGSKDRYFQEHQSEADKLVPEGVEAVVPCKGSVRSVLHQLMGGLRSGMGYTGCATIAELGTRARFLRMTPSGLAESHVHGVHISRPSPNYMP